MSLEKKIKPKTQINGGVLAFQGNVEEHLLALKKCGIQGRRVLAVQEVERLTHLIIPGGESTVMSAFLVESGLGKVIKERAQSGALSVFGTCAGAILLSKQVYPAEKVEPLGLIEADINRNAFGSQLHSFETEVEYLPTQQKIMATFIRAPQFKHFGESVEVLAHLNDEPILIRQDNVLASTFHPEYLEDPVIHRYFLEQC